MKHNSTGELSPDRCQTEPPFCCPSSRTHLSLVYISTELTDCSFQLVPTLSLSAQAKTPLPRDMGDDALNPLRAYENIHAICFVCLCFIWLSPFRLLSNELKAEPSSPEFHLLSPQQHKRLLHAELQKQRVSLLLLSKCNPRWPDPRLGLSSAAHPQCTR